MGEPVYCASTLPGTGFMLGIERATSLPCCISWGKANGDSEE